MELLAKIRGPRDLKRLAVRQLPALADEVRSAIIAGISRTGGHLSSSLGATDLIVALHYVFDTPQDKLVFDTGHQTYAHKLLTGRAGRFNTIRQKGGLSGFLKRYESEYDAFGAGHASTALSAAAGIAAARDQAGANYRVVAVVADGCMTGGMAWEAMQNIGQLRTDMLVVLNDNQMFISQRVGRLGAILTRLLTLGTVQRAERKVELFLGRFQFWGKKILRVAKRARVLFFPGMIFEEMGFSYFGPVDGHNLSELVEVLGYVKNIKAPILLHVVTKKGKGYEPAEAEPTEFHGAPTFDVETGLPKRGPARVPTFTEVFSDTLVKLAAADRRITAITAAMPEGTGLDAFRDKYPERYYDVGIAEEHAVTFAAGLAAEGARPVAAIYSSFMQRSFDQVMHDVSLQKLPVVIAMDRGGLVGEDGPTHHGVFDLGLFRMLPDVVLMAPADEDELQHMLRTAFALDLPVLLRYPRGRGFGVDMAPEPKLLALGRGRALRTGKDVNILAVGNRVHPAVKAAELLKARGVDAGVADMRFVKPLDGGLAAAMAAASSGRLVTAEDNALQGGFGSAVLEHLNEKAIRSEVLRLGIPDAYVEQGRPDELYAGLGLDSAGMAGRIAAWLGKGGQT